MPYCRRNTLVASSMLAFSPVLMAQLPGKAAKPRAGSNWERVQALPVGTMLHVTTDQRTKSCRIFAVTNEALTCAGRNATSAEWLRHEIKQLTLTHHVSLYPGWRWSWGRHRPYRSRHRS